MYSKMIYKLKKNISENTFLKIFLSLFFILSCFIVADEYRGYEHSKKNLVNRLKKHFIAFFINPTVAELKSSVSGYEDIRKISGEKYSVFKKCDVCHSEWSGKEDSVFYGKLKNSLQAVLIGENDEIVKFGSSLPLFNERNPGEIKNLFSSDLQKYIQINFKFAVPSKVGKKEAYYFSFGIPDNLISGYLSGKSVKRAFIKIFFLVAGLSITLLIFNLRRRRSLREIEEKVGEISQNRRGDRIPYKLADEYKGVGEKLDSLAMAINEREERIIRQNKGLEYLNVFMGSLNRSSNIKEQIDCLAEYISRLINFKRACVWIFDESERNVSEVYSFDSKGISFKVANRGRISVEKTYFDAIIDKQSTTIRQVLSGPDAEYAEDVFMIKERICTICYSPIFNEKGNVGFLTLLSEDEKSFTPEKIKYIEFLCENVCVSIQNSKLMESLTKSKKELSSIFKITRILASSLDLEDVFEELNEAIREIIDFDAFAVIVPSEKNRKKARILSSFSGLPFEVDKSGEFNRENTSIDIVLETGQPFLRRDTSKEQYFAEDKACTSMGIGAYISYPVWSKGKKAAVLSFYNKTKNYYSNEEIQILKPISEQIGVAIENSMLFKTIKKSREEWEVTFDSVNDHVCIISRNNIIIKVNRSLAKFLNKEPNELVGKKCHEVLYRSETCKNSCPHSKMKESGRTETGEMIDERYETRFLISVSPVKSPEGEITGALHIARDITEEKKLKEQLFHAEKMVSIGQLVSGVAHELNNPLAGINGYSQLLLENHLSEDARNKIERIKAQSERAAKIVQNLLAFARKKKPERVNCDINEVIMKSIELQQYELEAKKVNVTVNLNDTLPDVNIDPMQIQQVLLNLLVNAEHSVNERSIESGQIDVTSSLIEKDAKDFVQICVSDNGGGISEDITGRIFDPFFTTKEVGKGTGLGLSISYGIVLEHGGSIYAKNNKEGGAKFLIDLPVSEGGKSYKDNIIEFKPPAKKEKSKNVLVIDDEDDLRECVKEYFKRKQFNVFEAENGTDALKMIRKMKNFDYIISDIKMPEIGGEELYDRITKEFPNLSGRILFMTGDTSNDNTINFLKSNTRPYLLKPFTFSELETHLQKISA